MSKLTEYLDSVTIREGKEISISRAQIGEAVKILNDDSEGLLYALIEGGVFVPGSNPDARDSNPNLDAIKAIAKRL